MRCHVTHSHEDNRAGAGKGHPQRTIRYDATDAALYPQEGGRMFFTRSGRTRATLAVSELPLPPRPLH